MTLLANPIEEFPSAVKFIPNLKNLTLGRDNIKVLKRPFKTILYNLEVLTLFAMQSLTTVENCAFCSFPNLKSLYLINPNLTWIHENAFGAFNSVNDEDSGHRVEKLELFSIEHSNVSVLPEALLDWSNLKRIELGGNKFICNCSNAWLIDDIQNDNPTFSHNFRNLTSHGKVQCAGPDMLIGKFLRDVSTQECKEMVCQKNSKVIWFLAGILFTVSFVFFIAIVIFRNRIREEFSIRS